MIAAIFIVVGIAVGFAIGFFVCLNNAKEAQRKIDAAKDAANSAKKILNN